MFERLSLSLTPHVHNHADIERETHYLTFFFKASTSQVDRVNAQMKRPIAQRPPGAILSSKVMIFSTRNVIIVVRIFWLLICCFHQMSSLQRPATVYFQLLKWCCDVWFMMLIEIWRCYIAIRFPCKWAHIGQLIFVCSGRNVQEHTIKYQAKDLVRF